MRRLARMTRWQLLALLLEWSLLMLCLPWLVRWGAPIGYLLYSDLTAHDTVFVAVNAGWEGAGLWQAIVVPCLTVLLLWLVARRRAPGG